MGSPEEGVSSLHPCIPWDPRGCCQIPLFYPHPERFPAESPPCPRKPLAVEVPPPLWGPEEGCYWGCAPLQVLAFHVALKQESTAPGGYEEEKGCLRVRLVPCRMQTGSSRLSALLRGAPSPGNFPVTHPSTCPVHALLVLCGQAVPCGCAPFHSLSQWA